MTSCKRCGADLAPGSLKYLVTVNVVADFDGTLPTQAEMEDLEAFMRQLDREDPVQAEKDVYQSQGFVLCPACKAAFLADPLGMGEAGKTPAGEGGRIH